MSLRISQTVCSYHSNSNSRDLRIYNIKIVTNLVTRSFRRSSYQSAEDGYTHHPPLSSPLVHLRVDISPGQLAWTRLHAINSKQQSWREPCYWSCSDEFQPACQSTAGSNSKPNHTSTAFRDTWKSVATASITTTTAGGATKPGPRSQTTTSPTQEMGDITRPDQ
jgi:hypothetical protein